MPENSFVTTELLYLILILSDRLNYWTCEVLVDGIVSTSIYLLVSISYLSYKQMPGLNSKTKLQKFLKNENVHHLVTYNETKAQVVERFNKILKRLMWQMFAMTSSYHLDKLDSLVNGNYVRVCIEVSK